MSTGGSPKKTSKQGNSCHLLNVKQPVRSLERLKLSFQRVDAKLTAMKANKEYDVGLTLLDVSETGVGIYCNHMLSKGVAVELSILEPKILKVRGFVAWCVPAESKMNSLVVKYPYRSGIQFVFESDLQRVAIKEFMQKVRTKPDQRVATEVPVAAPAPDAAPTTAPAEPAAAAPVTPAASPAATPAPEAAATAPATPAAEAAAAPAAATPTEEKKAA